MCRQAFDVALCERVKLLKELAALERKQKAVRSTLSSLLCSEELGLKGMNSASAEPPLLHEAEGLAQTFACHLKTLQEGEAKSEQLCTRPEVGMQLQCHDSATDLEIMKGGAFRLAGGPALKRSVRREEQALRPLWWRTLAPTAVRLMWLCKGCNLFLKLNERRLQSDLMSHVEGSCGGVLRTALRSLALPCVIMELLAGSRPPYAGGRAGSPSSKREPPACCLPRARKPQLALCDSGPAEPGFCTQPTVSRERGKCPTATPSAPGEGSRNGARRPHAATSDGRQRYLHETFYIGKNLVSVYRYR